MKPKGFDYLKAASVGEATEALSRGGEDARLIAGGMSLVPMLNFRLVEPSILIDISKIADRKYIREENGMVEIGSATRQCELENWDKVGEKLPLLAKALPVLGHYQTRARGTVCGSLVHADPSSELPLCLATLGGEVVLSSSKGSRILKASDFQTGMLSVAKRADEMVTAARYPIAEKGVGYAFREMSQRHGDYAIVALAAVAAKNKIKLGVGGVADKPAVREWEDLDDSSLEDALNSFAWDLGGYDDIHASSRYRRELVRRLGKKTIEEARKCRN